MQLCFGQCGGIWLTIPLFVLSSYTGGLEVSQLVKCGAVLLMSCIFFALIGIGCALRNPPTRAQGIGYGFILLMTFLPLMPVPLFEAIPTLDAISPLCALFSILRLGSDALMAVEYWTALFAIRPDFPGFG